ncbi:hypothetical protein [Lysinibacillus sphaericus]|uniref:hypothetical protein n=1 Tax=Lysinibacillus sphaericus TaxID=1421 RepID=UPI003D7F7AE4
MVYAFKIPMVREVTARVENEVQNDVQTTTFMEKLLTIFGGFALLGYFLQN